MLSSSKGKVGIVMDNGCLFRGGKAKIIRQLTLEGDAHQQGDLIEAVILLPEKLFYNTGAPGAILIFNKNKKRKKEVLFINASSEYEQHPDVRKLNWLAEPQIKKIADTYKNWTEEPGFSRAVPLDEIRKNDYNLNVSLFVHPEEEFEDIDVMKEWAELKSIEKEETEVNRKIEGYLKEIR